MFKQPLFAVICAMLLPSCGTSGSWENDPGNWSRAFDGQTVPDDVVVVHSKYVRTPHFTYEAYYYFELKAPPAFLDAWRVQLVEGMASDADLLDKPTWFLPKPLYNYQMWTPSGPSHTGFRLFRDKEDGTIFATDSQGM